MKKICNIRLPAVLVCSLIAGILFSVILAYFAVDGAIIMAPVILLVVVGIFFVIYRKVSTALFIFAIAVFFFVGAVYCYAIYFSYCDTDVFVDDALMVKGVVTDTGVTSGGYNYIVIDDVYFGDTKVNGKLIGYLFEKAGDYCDLGYSVEFYTEPEKLSFFSDGSVASNAAKGIKYSCIIAGGMESTYRFSLFGEIALSIRNTLTSHLDTETANVCYAMLTGNADMISTGTLTSFRYGGVAHIFAVSGLHIGVVYGFFSTVFKRIGVNRFVSAILRIAIITAFAGVCNFTPSSVRAVVMCSVTAAASCVNRRYDSLNALSIAAMILLFINPLNLFSAGFVLSFAAMLGIVMLSRGFSEILCFLPDKVRSALSVGWSAQFATIPASAGYFGYVSAAGIFLNLIFIPVVSVFFVILLVVMVVCLVVPPLSGALIPAAAAPIQFIMNLVVTAGFEKSLCIFDCDYIFFVPFIAMGIAVSDKFNFKFRFRGSVFTVALSAFLCMALLPSYGGGEGISVRYGAGYDGGYMLLTNSYGSVLVVTEDIDGVPLPVLTRADSLVILGGDECITALFSLGVSFDNVYMRAGLVAMPSVGNYDVTYADEFTLCGIEFKYEGDCLCAEDGGATAAIMYVEKGNEYGVMPENCSLVLYCYGAKTPVLFDGENTHDLTVCGDLRYILCGGKIFSPMAILKE